MSCTRPKYAERANRAAASANNVDDDDENDEQTEEIHQHKADEVLRYLLISNQNQKPVHRADIVKNCFNSNEKNRFNTVFDEAKEKLVELFGIEILEAEDKKGVYFMSNTLTHAEASKHVGEESHIDGLLYAILSNIFMRDPKEKIIHEKPFNAFLINLGIDIEVDYPQDHPIFGDVKKLITKTFVEQGWLTARTEKIENPVDGTESTERYFGWGWRSMMVLARKDVLKFVELIMYPDHEPNQQPRSEWSDHYAVIEQEEANAMEQE